MAKEELVAKVNFGCYIAEDVLNKVDALAEKQQRSRNVMIERLLRAALDADIPA